MNDLQKIELDMLKVAIDICAQFDLKYYLVCGSCLGAVKYDGFIPWDDDIDIALSRSDYFEFCKQAKKMLPNHMFIQNLHSDPFYPYISSKIRNTRTTFIETALQSYDIVHGAYIDVFPLDGFQLKIKSSYIKKINRYNRYSVLWTNNTEDFSIRAIRTSIINAFDKYVKHLDVEEIRCNFEKWLQSYSCQESDIWCNHHEEHNIQQYNPKEWYGEGVKMFFEGLEVNVPTHYDLYLTKRYGDWRADLPEDQKVGHHYAEVIDLSRPYTDYIVKLKNGKIRLKTSEELLNSGITPPEGYKY